MCDLCTSFYVIIGIILLSIGFLFVIKWLRIEFGNDFVRLKWPFSKRNLIQFIILLMFILIFLVIYFGIQENNDEKECSALNCPEVLEDNNSFIFGWYVLANIVIFFLIFLLGPIGYKFVRDYFRNPNEIETSEKGRMLSYSKNLLLSILAATPTSFLQFSGTLANFEGTLWENFISITYMTKEVPPPKLNIKIKTLNEKTEFSCEPLITGFETGKHKLEESVKNKVFNRLEMSFKEKFPDQKLIGMLLVGSADKQLLSKELKDIYTSNEGLAYKRATWMKKQLNNHFSYLTPKNIIVSHQVPAVTEYRIDYKEHEKQRSVLVCSIWN